MSPARNCPSIGNYIDQHNKKPKPFIWTAKAADILEKVKRARATWTIGILPDADHSQFRYTGAETRHAGSLSSQSNFAVKLAGLPGAVGIL